MTEKNLFDVRRRNILNERTQRKKKIEKHIRKKEKEIRKVIKQKRMERDKKSTHWRAKVLRGMGFISTVKSKEKKERYLFKLCKQKNR